MDFAQQQRSPTRHLIGLTVVIVLHVVVIYALLTGLARTAIEVIKKPLTATIIEEVKLPPPPPPPPPKRIVEPPKAQAPVQPYVPPPDIGSRRQLSRVSRSSRHPASLRRPNRMSLRRPRRPRRSRRSARASFPSRRSTPYSRARQFAPASRKAG